MHPSLYFSFKKNRTNSWWCAYIMKIKSAKFDLRPASCFVPINRGECGINISLLADLTPPASTSSSSTRRWTTTSWRCGTARARAASSWRNGVARCSRRTRTAPSTSWPSSSTATTSSASPASPYSSQVRDTPFVELLLLMLRLMYWSVTNPWNQTLFCCSSPDMLTTQRF